MKNFNRLLGLIFVGLASTAMFVACADEEGQSCLTDTDCDNGFVCESDICVETCATDTDCPIGEMCEPRLGDGTENVCVTDPDYNNSTNNTTNNTTNNNNNGGDIAQALFVIDKSSGDACTGSDPGSDIVFLRLETLGGDVLGYGSLEYDGITGGDDNTYSAGFNLDGEAPTFAECPEFDETSVTALGCGGEIGVRFYDASGTPIPLELGKHQVFVFEYGAICGGTSVDEYELSVCTDLASLENGDTSSCTSVGGGSGQAIIEL